MTDYEDRIKREGRPFEITLTTPVGPGVATFDLDTTVYDTIAGFFKDKKLWVSAMRIECGAGETINAIRFDDKIVWTPGTPPVASVGLDLSGELVIDGIGQLVKAGQVRDKYGVQWLPIDFRFTLQNLGAIAASKVTLWGVYTKRNL